MSVTHDDYRRARHIGDALAPLLSEALRASKRGRKSMDARIFCCGLILSIDVYSSATVTEIHRVLTRDLPREKQWHLGVLRRNQKGEVTQLRVEDLYNFTRRFARLDYTPERAPDLSNQERNRRKRVLADMSDAILDATLPPRPNGGSDYALDGTGIWAHEKSSRSAPAVKEQIDHHEEDLEDTATHAADGARTDIEVLTPPTTSRGSKGCSDAGWGVKTAKDGGRESYFGYQAQAWVRIPDSRGNGRRRSEPMLVERLVLRAGNEDIVEPCFETMYRMLSDGIKIASLAVDRHYSYKSYMRWVRRLLAMGIRQIADMHANDQGFRDWDGIRMAAGWAHCPCTPDHLGVINGLEVDATDEEIEAFEARIDERQRYAAQRVAPLDAAGRVRFRCPARNGTVGCPRIEGTVAAAVELGMPIIQDAPPDETAPRICVQETVQLRVENEDQARAMKMHQKHYWGTPEWRRDFNRRTYVEGWFGVLKSSTATGLNRGSHQFYGLATSTLVMAAAAAVTNMRLLRTWHAETGLGDDTHPLLQPDEPFHGFSQLTAAQAAAIDEQCSPIGENTQAA